MAIVASTYEKNKKYDPIMMNDAAKNKGLCGKGIGTAQAFFKNQAKAMNYNYLGGTKSNKSLLNSVLKHLSEGHLVIVRIGPGHFTSGGHYMVLGGVDPDTKKVYVYDPNNASNSRSNWRGTGNGWYSFNDIIVKEISGQDVLDALELSMRFLPEKSPRFAQVSGISFKVNISIPSSVEVDENEVFVQVKGKRRVSNVKIGKEDLVLDKKYKIAFDNYIGNGGDGYSMFEKSEELYSTLIVDNQAVINYIKDKLNGTIPISYNETEGRIVIISTEDKDKEDDDSTNPSDDPEKKDKEDDNPTNPSDNPENKDKENGNSSDDHILLLAIIISISVVLLIIIIFIIYIKVNRKKHENDMKKDIENLNSKLNNEME